MERVLVLLESSWVGLVETHREVWSSLQVSTRDHLWQGHSLTWHGPRKVTAISLLQASPSLPSSGFWNVTAPSPVSNSCKVGLRATEGNGHRMPSTHPRGTWLVRRGVNTSPTSLSGVSLWHHPLGWPLRKADNGG